jgi:hypothetical protein
MRLAFKRNSQQEADALRAVLEATVSQEEAENRHNRGSSVPAFEVDASAQFVEKDNSSMYGREVKKEWQFVVTLEAANQLQNGEGDGGETSRRWRKLFEKLIQRPAIRAGTRVRGVPMFVTAAQFDEMILGDDQPNEEIDQNSRIASYFVKTLARGSFFDSEGRRAKHSETISFEVVPVPNGTTIVVDCDAIDAPLVAEVMQDMLKSAQRDIVYRAEKAARDALKTEARPSV